MDNLCHTLVGAALAEAGLKRRTALGTAALLIGANFPDIDVLAIPLGHDLGFRRGLTHGVPALIVLPFVLTGLLLLWERWRGPPDGEPPRAGQLLLLSAVSILTHPVLDWMNTYGMRWLAPLSNTWSYGDALFIVDPWIWLALGLGVLLSRRRARKYRHAGHGRVWDRIPARAALVAVAAYVAVMIVASRAARATVEEVLADRGGPVEYLMIDPIPVDPFRRRVVYLSEGHYHTASFSWRNAARLSTDERTIRVNDGDPLARRAAVSSAGREFLSWSRLPFYVIEHRGDSALVRIADARYTRGVVDSWASVDVMVPVR
jgi:inner membrane protein